MVDGRVFHKSGAALLNARAPHRVVVFGSISKWAPADLSDRVGTYSCRRSAMYLAASPFSDLYTWMSSLYCILCSTGSQCRFIDQDRFYMISDACTGDHTCRDVLTLACVAWRPCHRADQRAERCSGPSET